MKPAAWTDERVEQLKKLWETGLSASQIAAELGGYITRNAVIGKIGRLGLSGRVPGTKPGTVRTPRIPRDRMVKVRRAPSRVSVALAQAVAIEADADLQRGAEVIPFTQRCTLLDLTETNCHWPVGEPFAADFHFCGGKSLDGVPYCGPHMRMAYQPSSARSRQNPKPMHLRRGGSDAWR